MTQASAPTMDEQVHASGSGLSAWARVSWMRARARLSSMLVPHALVLLGPARGVSDGAAVEAALQAFTAWCEAHQGSSCELGLSSGWLWWCVAGPDESGASLREHALLQWAHYHGLDAAQIESQWLLRELVVPEAAILCAAPLALVDGLREVARTHGVQVRGMVPWWLSALQGWCAQLGGAPSNGASEDAPAATPCLHLWEPGLVTQVRASMGAQGMRIDRIWSEASDVVQGETAHGMPGSMALTLPPPVQDGDASEPAWHAGLWSHDGLRAVLQGDVRQEVPA